MILPNASDILAIVTSDLHVDERTWVDRDIVGDSMAAFTWICDLAEENNLPIIAAGDVLDHRRNESSPIGFLRQQLDRLPQPFFYIQGQHELQPSPWINAIHHNAMWLACAPGECYDLNGVNLYGIDWTPADKLPGKIAQIPAHTDVLVMHQVTQELMGSICVPEVSAQSLPYATRVIMGDYHRHRVVPFTGASGQSAQLLSPGSTNMREISEPAEKYVYLLHRNLTFESLRIPTRFVLRCDVVSEDMLDQFVATIGVQLADTQTLASTVIDLDERLRKPIIRVRFEPTLTLAYQRIVAAVGDAGHLFTTYYESDSNQGEAENIDAGESDANTQRNQLQMLGAAECLSAVVDAEQEPAVFNLCRRLVTEPEPAAVLAAVRSEFIQD